MKGFVFPHPSIHDFYFYFPKEREREREREKKKRLLMENLQY
jgi:hypothetical protein